MIIKPYYCPHCGKFKWKFQSCVSYGFTHKRVCKHCDRFLYDTKEEFKNYLNSKKDKAGEQE